MRATVSAARLERQTLDFRNGSEDEFVEVQDGQLISPERQTGFSLRCAAAGSPEFLLLWSCLHFSDDGEVEISCTELNATILNHVLNFHCLYTSLYSWAISPRLPGMEGIV